MTDQTTTEAARVLGDAQAGEMYWRRADGSQGEYVGPLRDLGHGIPRPDHGPGIRRALFDLAFGYVSGFPVRDILAYVLRSSFREGPVLEATAEEVADDAQDARGGAVSGRGGVAAGGDGTWTAESALAGMEVTRLRDELDTARGDVRQGEDRIDAVINLADQWEVTQQENRAALERGELAPCWTPNPQDFRLAATGCLEVPAVDPPMYRRRMGVGAVEVASPTLPIIRSDREFRQFARAGRTRPQDGTQAPQDGANGGDVGSGRGEGGNGAPGGASDIQHLAARYLPAGMTEGRCLTCPGGHGRHKVGGKYHELPHEVVVETKTKGESA